VNFQAFFHEMVGNEMTPKTGLSPTIDIYDVNAAAKVVDAQAMTEVGGGFYKYEYAISEDREYGWVCDAGQDLIGASRKAYAGAFAFGDYKADLTGLSADLAAVETKTDRILGLVHENMMIDQCVFDADDNLTSGRLRIYSAAASVGTGSDVVATYTITAVGAGPGKFDSWRMVKD